MKYRKPIKWSIMLISLMMALAGCEGPGPEYQTPMAAYPEAQDNSLPAEMATAPKMAYEEIHREKKTQDLRTVFLFNSNKSRLTSTQKQILKKQASYLKENPKSAIRVERYGYNNTRDKKFLNKKIASLKSNEIAKVFKMEGISADRIEIVSYDVKKSPIKNRRVELIILPDGKSRKS